MLNRLCPLAPSDSLKLAYIVIETLKGNPLTCESVKVEDQVTEFLVKGAYVYDPFNGIDGEKMDIAIRNGKIVRSVNPKRARVINMPGMIAMPGGVDVNAHICGPKVNTARKSFNHVRRAYRIAKEVGSSSRIPILSGLLISRRLGRGG